MTSPDPVRKGRWLPLVATCLGTFLLLVYTTIVTVALSHIADDLDASFGSLQWIVDVYTLALAGLLMGMGSLGDNLGRKRLYVTGLVVFTLATLACGLAGNVQTLVAARAVQGVAGAAMFATLLPLIGLTYSGTDKAKAFAAWGAVAGASAGVGNIAGGMLTQFLSWQWIFLGAVPVCALTIALSVKVLDADARTPTRVDWAGIVTFTLAAIGIIFGFIRGGEKGWSDPATIGGFGAGAVLLLAFVLVERASAHPMLPLELFRKPAFDGMLLSAGGYYLAGYAFLPVMSLWLQKSLGLSSFATSLVITVQSVAFFATSALLGSSLHRLPARWTIGGGSLIVGLGNLALLMVGPDSSWPVLLPGLVITGFGAGLVSPVLPAVAMASAPPEHSGVASAAANCARQFGLTLGIAVLGTVFHHYVPGTGAGASPAAYADGLGAVFLLGGLVGLLGGVVGLWLLKRPVAAPEPGPAPAGMGTAEVR
ncbi:MFS transporter [Streptomyces caatingaensis]|uniref:Multidrug transporter n=1 Tax=Streptomyces caatingaensis TaxID=1678637 RepID=A0A0K9X8N9_9ACTN|nr:MFS transporter [Streptomyces caatingaensis]KNB49790.1 multidrug transporter [Streptomyces caatingaensis]